MSYINVLNWIWQLVWKVPNKDHTLPFHSTIIFPHIYRPQRIWQLGQQTSSKYLSVLHSKLGEMGKPAQSPKHHGIGSWWMTEIPLLHWWPSRPRHPSLPLAVLWLDIWKNNFNTWIVMVIFHYRRTYILLILWPFKPVETRSPKTMDGFHQTNIPQDRTLHIFSSA